MQMIEQKAQPNLFEVTLYFEGDLWSFSTSAQATRFQEALERAEKDFSIHSMHHRLSNRKMKATSAFVFSANDNQSFTKQDGKWRPAH